MDQASAPLSLNSSTTNADNNPSRNGSSAQWLVCPMLDDRTAARNELDATNHHLWNNASNRVGWRSYLNAAREWLRNRLQ